MWESVHKQSWLKNCFCNCGDRESWQSLGMRVQSWVFIGRTDVEVETPNTLATWCKELTHLKRPLCWERLREGEEGDDRGWDGWMASPTQTWVWVNSGSWWCKGRPCMLRFMGSQGVRHNWAIELNCWIIVNAREFQKNIYFCFIDYAKAFDCVDHSKLWKVLKEMGIPDHLTCLLRNLYAGPGSNS